MKKFLILCTFVGALPSQAGWVGNIFVPDGYDEETALRMAMEASQEGSSSPAQDPLELSEKDQLELALKLSMQTLEGSSTADSVTAASSADGDEFSFMARRNTLRKSEQARAVDAKRRVSGMDQLARHGDHEEARVLEESAFLHKMNTLRQKADTPSESSIDKDQEKWRQAMQSNDVGSELKRMLARRKKLNGE